MPDGIPCEENGVAKAPAPILAPVSVCLHVLKEARSDVRALRTAQALSAAGCRVVIVDIEAQADLPVDESIQGVHIHHILMPRWRTSRRVEVWFLAQALQAFALSVLRLLRAQADIYHANELTALPACFIAACLRRKLLIYEIYDLQFPVPDTAVVFWRRAARLITWLHALIIPRCAAVIVTSPFHAREIRKRFRVREIALVRNIPMYQKVNQSQRLRAALDLGPETRIALFQGTLQEDRRLDLLVRAASFLRPDCVLVLMGKGEGNVQRELETLIASEGVSERVRIVPAVAFAELLSWTASADIGLIIYDPDVSLNIRTHLPNKLFEYLMAGLPVLSTQLDAVVEIITTYDVGRVVSSLDPAQLALAMNTLLADPVALTCMHTNALHAARNNLCWENEKIQLLQVYQKIITGYAIRGSQEGLPEAVLPRTQAEERE